MKIDHIGIAVRDIEEASAFYRRAFGLKVVHEEAVKSQRVRVAFLADDEGDATSVELLEADGAGSAIESFLRARGPGLHHMAFRASRVSAEMERLRAAGTPAQEDAPRPGARGHSVCFLHPRHAHGVLVELVGEK